jgi:3',5'-cyclic AMP phosphodiesterase CpdA
MGKFLVLHASDLHLAEIPDRAGFPGWLHVLRGLPTPLASHGSVHPYALAQFVFNQKPHLVLLSGDIATSGAAANLLVASEFIDSKPSGTFTNANKRPTLATARRVVIPGNHDRFHGHVPYLPNHPAFDRTFPRHWRGSSRVKTLEFLTDRADSTHLAVIGADFSLRRITDATDPRFGYLGQGRVDDPTLRALQAETRRVRRKYKAVAILWVVHFAPQFPKLARYLKLIDGGKLLSAAKAMKVPYILSGHTHAASDYLPVPGVQVLCAGTAMEFGARIQCIHMREFSVTPGTGAISHSQTQYNWDATARQYL